MDDAAELEEQAYLRALLAQPDVRIRRGPGGELVLELRALEMPGAARPVPKVRPRVWRTSAEAAKPYQLVRARRARTAGGL